MTVTAADLAAFLGQGEDPDFLALAETAVSSITAIVRTYTRTKGFDALGEPTDEVAAVILTAAARMAVNPHQNRREELGDYNVTPARFEGFTLAETMVLNTYRRRTA